MVKTEGIFLFSLLSKETLVDTDWLSTHCLFLHVVFSELDSCIEMILQKSKKCSVSELDLIAVISSKHERKLACSKERRLKYSDLMKLKEDFNSKLLFTD